MFSEPLKLFLFMGAPVRLHLSWLPLAAVLGWLLYQHVFPVLVPELRHGAYRAMAFFGLLVLLASVLFRELARVLAARLLEIPLDAVTLHVFGGVAELPEAGSKSALILAAIGFAASVLLGALVAWGLIELVTARTPLALIGVAFFAVLLNWALAVLNAVPAGLRAAWRYWST